MEEVDADGNGFIDYSEFLMAATRRDVLLASENLESAFKAFDIDGNGTITAEELRGILGENDDQEDVTWHELIAMADKDGNGEIDLKEFKEMMIKFL